MKKKLILIIIGGLISLILVYNIINQIISTLKSGDRLSLETEKLNQLEVQNKELKQKLSEVQTLEFLEKEARDKLGYVKEDETLVIIPDEKIDEILNPKKPEEEKLPNWQGWLKIFFHSNPP